MITQDQALALLDLQIGVACDVETPNYTGLAQTNAINSDAAGLKVRGGQLTVGPHAAFLGTCSYDSAIYVVNNANNHITFGAIASGFQC